MELVCRELFNKIQDYASTKIYGIDFDPKLVKASKMNMVMNNDGSGGLFSVNSLEHPNMWDDETRKHVKLGGFKVVITNPPFGKNIKVDDPRILEQYDLAHIWEATEDGFAMTKRYKSSVAPEILFIERCTQFLKENGRMAIVLPNGILSDPDLEYVRYWILHNHEVMGSVSLPVETFLPYTGTKTGVLFLRKKTNDERLTNAKPSADAYFKAVSYIGKDRRGKVVYKLDERGNEIVKKYTRKVERKNSKGEIEVEQEEYDIKVVNDETNEAAKLYLALSS